MPMMMIDGPEKAGKTTLITAIKEKWEEKSTNWCSVQHWGPVTPDDSAYTEQLMNVVKVATNPNALMIWDRGWAAEHVYGKLLGRDRRLATDPWLGEWIHSRAVKTNGSCFIASAPEYILEQRRDASDLKVKPADEKREFENYGVKHGWRILDTGTTKASLQTAVEYALSALVRDTRGLLINPPPVYCGPRDARVIFIGDAKSDNPKIPGAWLPFSSRASTEFARLLGEEAMLCGWTNARDCMPQQLRSAQLLVSCGEAASHWVSEYVNPHQHVNMPSPAYLFKNKKNEELWDQVRQIMEVIRQKYLL